MSEVENAWLRAIDEALTAAHIGIASVSDDYDTAKRKIGELIDWHVAVATDPAVNGGWKLVPVEPTQEMIAAAFKESTIGYGWIPTHYRAMLAAAPTPPVDENTSQERVRLPEPMTDNEIVEIYRALPKNSPIVRGGSTTVRLGRAIEAEVMRRVQEANK